MVGSLLIFILSPWLSHFKICLNKWSLRNTQGTSPWNDVSKIEENIVAWRQYLEKNYGATAVSGGVEGTGPNKLKLSDEEDVTELVKLLQSKEVEIADLKKGQKVCIFSG